MKTVLEEVISDEIEADHIERRVKDWEKRLNALFGKLREWLPHGWEAHAGSPYLMIEEMMRQFGIPPKQLPTLELHHPSKPVIKLVPHALWIVGANGRIDVRGTRPHYFIVDTAELFCIPKWEASCLERRREHEALSKDWIRRILE